MGGLPVPQSALWIRRGGPPDKPVVLVDYEVSKSGQTVYKLLCDFKGYLVTDGADNFKLRVWRNSLCFVLCNDHARKCYRKALQVLAKNKSSIARTAMQRYGKLYRIESQSNKLRPDERHTIRQKQAIPKWDEFLALGKRVFTEGVANDRTNEALSYLLKHHEGLRAYCLDSRLPISNIKSEHVAKTIAVMCKNFLFADTPSGATASARIFCVIETARANHHNPYQYLSVLLTELPQATSL